jgi:hypothetical protein
VNGDVDTVGLLLQHHTQQQINAKDNVLTYLMMISGVELILCVIVVPRLQSITLRMRIRSHTGREAVIELRSGCQLSRQCM